MKPKNKLSKRAALRFTLPGKTISYMANGELGRGTLANISSGGCLVKQVNKNLEKHDQVLVVVEFSEEDRPLEIKGVVLRATEGEFCAKFTNLESKFQNDFTKILANEARLNHS